MTSETDGRTTIYKIDGLDAPSTIRTDHLITSVMVTKTDVDDRVVVYNRSANAGHLFLRKGDGEAFARKLLENS